MSKSTTRGNPTLDLVRSAPGFGVAGRFLMLVKTYPIPSSSYEELVCCAGLDAETGRWIRMYPVNFRTLGAGAQFRKWQFIEATWSTPRSDRRPESRRVHQDSIRAGSWLDPGDRWRRRRQWLDPIVDESVESLIEEQRLSGRTLGVIRPAAIQRLEIRPAKGWDEAATAGLAQLALDWGDAGNAKADLELIPFDFIYHFTCRGPQCRGHEMEIFDWEAGQAYRQFRRRYGPRGWEAKFRAKWEVDLPSRDLHFVLGTHHKWGNWMIVGVLYPPEIKADERDRRGRRDGVGQQGAMTLPGFGLEAE